ncbi:MAG: hypothetical protein ACLSG5_02685 [Oscillospiraceae bacterium]
MKYATGRTTSRTPAERFFDVGIAEQRGDFRRRGLPWRECSVFAVYSTFCSAA